MHSRTLEEDGRRSILGAIPSSSSPASHVTNPSASPRLLLPTTDLNLKNVATQRGATASGTETGTGRQATQALGAGAGSFGEAGDEGVEEGASTLCTPVKGGESPPALRLDQLLCDSNRSTTEAVGGGQKVDGAETPGTTMAQEN